jgi:thiamine pyrophosphokinase
MPDDSASESINVIVVGSAIDPDEFEWFASKTEQICASGKTQWVAADGGLDHCMRLGVKPDMVVGDWDSVSDPEIVQGLKHDTLDEDKDRSDFAHALAIAYEFGATRIFCFGVTGGDRPDHQVASLHEMARAAEVGEDQLEAICAHDPLADYYFISTEVPRLNLNVKKGQRISIFAWNGPAQGVKFSGLEFKLESDKLNPTSRGLSNRAIKDKVEVKVKEGTLLVVVPVH